jgi:hypothetical protein
MQARAEATFVKNVRASHFTDTGSDVDRVCRLCGSGEKESLLHSARPRSVSQSRRQVGPSGRLLRRGLLNHFLTERDGVEVLHTLARVPTICALSVHLATLLLGGVVVSPVSWFANFA